MTFETLHEHNWSRTASTPRASTSLWVGHLASQLRSLVAAVGKRTSAGSGLSFSESSATFGRDGLWRRTFRGYSQLTLDGHSEPFLGPWSRWGIVWGGQYMALTRSERPTGANGSSLWPTPVASNPNEGERLSSWQARRAHIRARRKNGNGFGIPLAMAVQLWPTPKAQNANGPAIHGQGGPDLQTAVHLWQTPAAQDSKNATLPPSQQERDTLPGQLLRQLWRTPQADENGSIVAPQERKGHNLSLSNQVQGQLNPEFVEMLMGFPRGWTDIAGLPRHPSHSSCGNRRGQSRATHPSAISG